jgi:outer membrane protein assembly factor BamB
MGFRMLRTLGMISTGAALLAAVTGCQAHGSGPTEVSATAGRGRGPRLPDELLRKHGLESLLYNAPDPIDTPVQMAHLSADALFVVTTPSRDKKGRLKLLSRANLHPQWYFEIAEPLRGPPHVFKYPPGPTPRPDELYFTQLDTVYCLDLKHSDILWRQQLPFPVSTPVAADELRYFVGSDNGRAYGIQKRSNVDEWTYRTGDVIATNPQVEGRSVFFTSSDGSAYRFTTPAGWVRGSSWKVDTGSRIVCDPVVFSRWVIVGSTDFKLYCLEQQDGTAHWTFQAEAPVEDTPVVYSLGSNQEYVYAIAVSRTRRGDERTLFSIKLTNGQEAWRKTKIAKVVAIGKKNLYVLEDTGGQGKRQLLALDIQNGAESFRLPVEGFNFVPTNLADNGRNAKERGRIYLVAADGTIQVIGERL